MRQNLTDPAVRSGSPMRTGVRTCAFLHSLYIRWYALRGPSGRSSNAIDSSTAPSSSAQCQASFPAARTCAQHVLALFPYKPASHAPCMAVPHAPTIRAPSHVRLALTLSTWSMRACSTRHATCRSIERTVVFAAARTTAHSIHAKSMLKARTRTCHARSLAARPRSSRSAVSFTCLSASIKGLYCRS